MSKFLTALPVNVKDLIDALPKNSFVHGITFDPATNEVQVLWENDRLETGLSVPILFKQEDFGRRKLPEGIRDARKPKPVQTPPVEENAPEVKPEPPKAPPVYLTEEEYNEAIAQGKAVEYYGLETLWKPVDPKNHTFTTGFYYRIAVKQEQQTTE